MHPSAAAVRDHRLDFFRGLALVFIFINHVPGNVLEAITSRNFGFSDAAEAFVLMSGIAAGLAYGRGFMEGEYLKTARKVWKRAFKLYRVHLAITLCAVVILTAGLVAFDETTVFSSVNMLPILHDPVRSAFGVLALGHQLGYFNILPLYMVLMAAVPAMVWIALRSRLLLLCLSVSLWLFAGTVRINLPNFPTDGGWFLNPLSWQLVFVIGLLAGLAAKRRERIVPKDWRLTALCSAFLLYAFLVVKFSLWRHVMQPDLPAFLGGFDKTYLSLQRLLHVLAIAYLLSNMAAVTRIVSSSAAKPIILLGKNSLAVFATGSVICIALQVARSIHPVDWHADVLLLGAGFASQYVAARISDASKTTKSAEPMGAYPPTSAAAAA